MLAGGASRRLSGIPKGLEIVGGRRIIDRVADALRPLTARLVLAANNASAHEWLPGVAVLTDEYPRAGGLAGVHAALSLGAGALVVAWDMPFVTTDLLAALLRLAPDSSVVVPESLPSSEVEPFCAYYSAAVRDPLGSFLSGGGGAARDFLGRTDGVRRLSAAEVNAIGDPRRLFFSVNTPEDLARARAMAGGAE